MQNKQQHLVDSALVFLYRDLTTSAGIQCHVRFLIGLRL